MTDIYKYRIWCETDSKYEYVWGESEPTGCPTNTAHNINSSGITIVENKLDQLVIVQEEETSTGGHFSTIGIKSDVSTSGWSSHDFSFPVAVNLMSAEFVVNPECHGDEIEFHIAPDTIIGVNSITMASGTNVITMSSVPSAVFIGMWVSIDNVDLGRITTLTPTTITTENNISVEKTSGKYIKVTVKMAPILYLEEGYPFEVGTSKIGGSYLVANKKIRLKYNNKNGQSKSFVYRLEYLY